MKIVEQEIAFGEEHFLVTNQRVMFWPSEQALILSDLHLGKTTHFRQNGIAVPQEIMHDDLERLEQLINYFSPKQIIVVGDLFHAGKNVEFDVFAEWKQQFSIHWILIKGNHDRFSEEIYSKLELEVENKLTIGRVNFNHHPVDEQETYTISGHIHPGVSLKGMGRQRIKLPCFLYSNWQLILPAFSKFTGLDTRLSKQYKAIGFTDEALIAL